MDMQQDIGWRGASAAAIFRSGEPASGRHHGGDPVFWWNLGFLGRVFRHPTCYLGASGAARMAKAGRRLGRVSPVPRCLENRVIIFCIPTA